MAVHNNTKLDGGAAPTRNMSYSWSGWPSLLAGSDLDLEFGEKETVNTKEGAQGMPVTLSRLNPLP